VDRPTHRLYGKGLHLKILVFCPSGTLQSSVNPLKQMPTAIPDAMLLSHVKTNLSSFR